MAAGCREMKDLRRLTSNNSNIPLPSVLGFHSSLSASPVFSQFDPHHKEI